MTKDDQVKNIVVLGGGFAGLYALKALRKKFGKSKNHRIILVNDTNYFLFTPLLHEVATGGISIDNAIEPLRKVARGSFDEFCLCDVERIDLDKKKINTSNNDIDYDYLVVALGSETFFYGIPGAEENSFTLKSLDDARNLKQHFLCSFEKASMIKDKNERQKLLNFVVIGGGPTGVELASEMNELFRGTFSKYFDKDLVNECKISLIQSGEVLLPQFSDYFQHKSYQALVKKHGIDVELNEKVVEVGEDFVKLSSGSVLETNTPIWTAGVAPRNVDFVQGPKKDNRGRIIVNEFNQLEDYPEVFIAGDMAAFKDANGQVLPATAQVASRQGPVIAENIYCMSYGSFMSKFEYEHAGNLVSLGRWKALAEIKSFRFDGHFAWWMWRTIYLMKLITFPKKLKVIIDWTVGIFTTRDISEC